MKNLLFLLLVFSCSFVFAQNLDVEGDAIIFGSLEIEGSNEFIDFKTTSTSFHGVRFFDAGSFSGAMFFKSSDDRLNITSGTSTPGIVFDFATNNTGIGEFTPSAKLDVVGTSELNGDTDVNGKLTVTDPGSEIARFSSTAGSKWISLYDGPTRRGILWSTGTSIKLVADAGNVAIQTGGNVDRLSVATTGNIDMGGNLYSDVVNNRVGVFTTSPDYTFEVEHISGTPGATTGNGLTIKNKIGGVDNHWSFYNWSSGDLSIYKGGTLKGTFDDVDGMYTMASDKRLKTNITLMQDNILDKIKLLKPSRYHFKKHMESHKEFGLIAQEVQQVFPELTPIIESTSEGAEMDLLGVNYTEFVPILIKAIQEQQEIIENLQNRIEALEAK